MGFEKDRKLAGDAALAKALVALENASRTSQSGEDLFAEVNLAVDAGASLGVAGRSGSGKTTLLRALGGLDPLTRGRLLWQGREVHGRDYLRFRQDVAYLHQSPVLVDGTVEENLALPFMLKSTGAAYDGERVRGYLDDLDFPRGLLEKGVTSLSGGERQVVCLIRLLQLSPRVLLLDEPTAALDEQSASAFESAVEKWQHDNAERAFVWVSHDKAQLARVAGGVLEMDHGRLSV